MAQCLQPSPLPAPPAQALPYDAEVAGVRQVAKEAESLEGNRLLAYLHGAVLVRPEPPEAGPWPDTTPERLPKTVLSAVYCLLQVGVGSVCVGGVGVCRPGRAVAAPHWCVRVCCNGCSGVSWHMWQPCMGVGGDSLTSNHGRTRRSRDRLTRRLPALSACRMW